ncbi:hypothetical protein GALMADRAFT_255940 [Galerina marginata CBS 339.88]|uniref:Nephrocystin 3-like N-terminal domain-containing protein n=1 Tax=Galerina marginata (strain CBS 339.88) TaxID=685588 RepID=A0A067SEW9_GALM3|nr:hypothetical protein GALMADRAFT_255940 [Galerina marginata CBS 339.88]
MSISMFNNARDFSIVGGNITNITTQKSRDGIDLLREAIAPGAFHNSSERYDPPKCHPNTRVAVIQAIIDWIEDGQKTTFIKWLNGPAGAGKSAIAQEIAELCQESGRLAASFFWSRNAADRNDERRLIASLAYKLVLAIPQIRTHVQEALENDPSLLTLSLETQMETLIIEPLQKAFGDRQQRLVDLENPRVIILDGLDECGTPDVQQYILKVIAHAVRKFPIPLFFLISSRPELAIRDSFNNHPLLSITAQLALDEEYCPDDDIRLFLVESFDSVKRTHILRSSLPGDWPTNSNIDQLVHKSSGQFIYAATVIKFVRNSRRRPVEQLNIILGLIAARHDTPFAELDALYFQIFSMVEDLPRVLEVLSYYFLIDDDVAPSPSQIETMLSYPPGDIQLILIDLHSVLSVGDVGDNWDQVYVLHASLRDFFMDRTRSQNFYIDKAKASARIVQHLLRYLRNYSPQSEDSKINIHDDHCLYLAVVKLQSLCAESSAMRELLADFFDFDFRHWAAVLAQAWDDYPVHHYTDIFSLYDWFHAQEATVQTHFGPERSLSGHHSLSWGFEVEKLCHLLFSREELGPEGAKLAATATTHPRICHYWGDAEDFGQTARFERVMGAALKFNLLVESPYNDAELPIIHLQKYLCDPERSGSYFVNSSMYATLSMKIFEYVFDSERFRGITSIQEECNDGHEHNDDDDDVEFAIEVLPFYLSNADYTPDLAKIAERLLEIKAKPAFKFWYRLLESLCKAIETYLKRAPLIPHYGERELQGSLDVNPFR